MAWVGARALIFAVKGVDVGMAYASDLHAAERRQDVAGHLLMIVALRGWANAGQVVFEEAGAEINDGGRTPTDLALADRIRAAVDLAL